MALAPPQMGLKDMLIFVFAAAFRALDILAWTMRIHQVPFHRILGGALIAAKGALKLIRFEPFEAVFNAS